MILWISAFEIVVILSLGRVVFVVVTTEVTVLLGC